jgi:hypothetical protein
MSLPPTVSSPGGSASTIRSWIWTASRRFSGGADYSGGWLEGVAQTGAAACFVPVAVFESLHETPADEDGTAWRLWEEAYHGFEQRRQDAVLALTARWGSPEPYSFNALTVAALEVPGTP